jgi:hypothetical protein
VAGYLAGPERQLAVLAGTRQLLCELSLPGAGPLAGLGASREYGSAQAYRETVRQMVRTGTLLDAGMVYFDAPLSERYPTIEIRVADVCLQADDAVLIAALDRRWWKPRRAAGGRARLSGRRPLLDVRASSC